MLKNQTVNLKVVEKVALALTLLSVGAHEYQK